MRPCLLFLLGLGLAPLPAALEARELYERPIRILISDVDQLDTCYVDQGRQHGVNVGDEFQVGSSRVRVTAVFERMAAVKVVSGSQPKAGQQASFVQRPLISNLEPSARRSQPGLRVPVEAKRPAKSQAKPVTKVPDKPAPTPVPAPPAPAPAAPPAAPAPNLEALPPALEAPAPSLEALPPAPDAPASGLEALPPAPGSEAPPAPAAPPLDAPPAPGGLEAPSLDAPPPAPGGDLPLPPAP